MYKYYIDHLATMTPWLIINPIRELPTPLREDLKETFNGPSNMIFVDKSTNRSVSFNYLPTIQGRMPLTLHRCIQKGAYTGQALKAPVQNPPAREDHKKYLPVEHYTAHDVSREMDNHLKNVPVNLWTYFLFADAFSFKSTVSREPTTALTGRLKRKHRLTWDMVFIIQAQKINISENTKSILASDEKEVDKLA